MEEGIKETYGGLLPNDSLLAVCVVLLLAFLLSELWKDRGGRSKKSQTSLDSALLNPVPSSRFHVPLPFPVYEGVPRTVIPVQNTTTLLRYLPQRQTIYEVIDMDEAESKTSPEEAQMNPTPAVVDEPLTGLPNQPGIEFNSQLVIKLHQKLSKEFPESCVSRNDVVRFLVARKGNVEAAVDMFRKAFKWHASSLPLRATPDIIKCLSAKCFFAHGVDRDGAPVLYRRGALYDSKRGAPETYVLVAAHAIAHALRNSKHCAITCMVHAVAVPGAANENTDINFIKGFVQVSCLLFCHHISWVNTIRLSVTTFQKDSSALHFTPFLGMVVQLGRW